MKEEKLKKNFSFFYHLAWTQQMRVADYSKQIKTHEILI